MRLGAGIYSVLVGIVHFPPPLFIYCDALPSTGVSASNLDTIWDTAPAPEHGPSQLAAVRDQVQLPAQIGGIVGAYAISLVLVAGTLLILSKRRRDRLRHSDIDLEFARRQLAFNPFPQPFLLQSGEDKQARPQDFPYPLESPKSSAKHISLPAKSPISSSRLPPLRTAESQLSSHPASSPVSSVGAPGFDPAVDQAVAARDRAMAQTQLEEMYRYVMEQEEARLEGREYEPDLTPFTRSWPNTPVTTAMPTKGKSKPGKLKLVKEEKPQCLGAAFLSFLKTPRSRKTPPRGLDISAPIMTPLTSTFPYSEEQEMYIISPRQYTPAAPPPIPADVLPFRRVESQLPTPDLSPSRVKSIDERIDVALDVPQRSDVMTDAGRQRERDSETCECGRVLPSRDHSAEGSRESEPVSAVSQHFQRYSASALVGLPATPRPGMHRFPSVDTLSNGQTKRPSPRPDLNRFVTTDTVPTRQSKKPPPMPPNISVVRPGGALPLRAYEPNLPSATGFCHTTRQTVFTRPAPQSPGMATGMQTPWTGAPVPYTPYQPFSPVVPITPSLLTRKDRKRLKKMEAKSPTAEMVEDEDDMWG